ncbi:50S ribosomal protein L17 [Listeria fleischmannii 1991]|jgi:large subunit ribosomal protein L17|uniref:Large ribosomal subunit protein bL17 n=5 Tax=Listeria fleischmannii TaxID=1069827 RepID=A0A2X3GL38_9LIST|nr:50S ribosomal protein L17 [Listeria fleischmannii]EIA21514.1 50S ribosomal protein L17 [Listeria fleischmannii subsp. coloradonensis]EUJ53820.1 50S ribosomal protein L17 [Listeria fleischmannii FSL S10-1203]KMT60252.1 50S ribosomal protein L17 [Listeria fleischmannii 1991]MBC1397911.1 50S ribosomal protein L17 [Listeria fleischmannii]MBC1417746.1 50S ribosomal protein L17 [Listeria fleischmannii]
MGYRKLGRTSSQRKALLRDLATDLIVHERIETTEARAKEIRKVVEKLITSGKKGDLHARRQAAAFVRHEVADVKQVDVTKNGETVKKNQAVYALQKLFDDVAPRYADRQGGYTRIYKKGPRRGDGAPMVIIELV